MSAPASPIFKAVSRICTGRSSSGGLLLLRPTLSRPLTAITMPPIFGPFPRLPSRPFGRLPARLCPAAASAAATEASPPPHQATATTYYSLFPTAVPRGPPPQGPFALDTRQLRREFLRLQAKVHPDARPAHLRAGAEIESAQLNDAFRTLLDPLLRAQYLLRLRGIDAGGDEQARSDAESDAEMLMNVMDAHEEMESAAAEADLEGTRARNEERIRACEEALERAFGEDDLEQATGQAGRLKYWMNIRQALDGWEKGRSGAVMH